MPQTRRETDLFSTGWHERDEGRELECTNVRTLVGYLLSGGANSASVSDISLAGVPSMTVRVLGPRCGDGKPLEVSHGLDRREFSSLLSGEERRRFVAKLVDLMAPEVPSWRVYAVLGLPRP